jgi:hypothetical protein
MNITHDDFLKAIDNVYCTIMNSKIEDILDIDNLTSIISEIGLYNEGDRKHPQNRNVHLYGDDVKYMNIVPNVGMWQIPRQLAGFLIQLVNLGNIDTFLDIGTCRGATITIVAIFLSRFGIKKIETIDVIKFLHDDLKKKWEELNLPITYTLIPLEVSFNNYVSLKRYDVIFIDGNHDYKYVLNDYITAKTMTTKICFHDINDCFCHDVVRLWSEIKKGKKYMNTYEFTHHSHGYKLMGIGLVINNE